MTTTICYTTGTGNSLWVARTLAERLSDSRLLSIADWQADTGTIDSHCLGLVFPVYVWGLPARIIRFVDNLTALKPDYVFAIAVNGGQVANTLVQLDHLLGKGGLSLSAGWEITMPSNYIPWGGPGPKEKQDERFASALRKIAAIAPIVKSRGKGAIEKGPLWQRVFFSLFYRLSFSQIPKMDRKFWVDEKCNGCALCSKVCPSRNIIMESGKPSWYHRCEQCFACLQWCPKEAIQYGKKTPGYERYHHPEIHVKDIIKAGEDGAERGKEKQGSETLQ